MRLFLVVQRKAKGIAERHQRPLHGVRLGFLDCAFVRQAKVNVDAMPRANAFARHASDDYARFGDVGHAPAGFLFAANLARAFGNHADFDRLARPVAEAEYAVGFGYRVPAFDVRKLAARLVALLDVRAVQGLV